LSKWYSFENLKWVLATLAIPLTLAYLNQQYQDAQTVRQSSEARLRLYTELLSKREEADTSLRKGVFDKVLDTYLKEAKNVEAKLIGLELLTLNFHDSLDLSPLFWEILREIEKPQHNADRLILMKRLERAAYQVKEKQIEILRSYGAAIAEGNLYTEVLSTGSGTACKMDHPIDQDFSFDDPDAIDPGHRKQTRHFRLDPLECDPKGRRLFVSIEWKLNSELKHANFWVDEYDFPLTDFYRLSKSERFAVVMSRYEPPDVGLSLIYFPSSRSGIKDKPFIDEVISNLKRDVNE